MEIRNLVILIYSIFDFETGNFHVIFALPTCKGFSFSRYVDELQSKMAPSSYKESPITKHKADAKPNRLNKVKLKFFVTQVHAHTISRSVRKTSFSTIRMGGATMGQYPQPYKREGDGGNTCNKSIWFNTENRIYLLYFSQLGFLCSLLKSVLQLQSRHNSHTSQWL